RPPPTVTAVSSATANRRAATLLGVLASIGCLPPAPASQRGDGCAPLHHPALMLSGQRQLFLPRRGPVAARELEARFNGGSPYARTFSANWEWMIMSMNSRLFLVW